MLLPVKQRWSYGAFLAFTILLVGLHLFVIKVGHDYYSEESNIGINFINSKNFSERDFNLQALFWLIASALILGLSIVLYIGTLTNCPSPKTRHKQALMMLMLQLAIAFSLWMAAATISNRLEFLYDKLNYKTNDDLNLYYRLLVVDSVATFIAGAVSMALLFLGTLDEVAHKAVSFYI